MWLDIQMHIQIFESSQRSVLYVGDLLYMEQQTTWKILTGVLRKLEEGFISIK